MKRKQEEANQRETLIRRTERELGEARAELDRLPPAENLQEKKDKLANEMSQHQKKIGTLDDKLRRFTSEKTQLVRSMETVMKKLKKEENYKIQMARKMNVEPVVRKLEEMKHQFQSPVYGPLFCEIRVSNPLHGKFLQSKVRSGKQKALICQNRHDFDLLSKTFRNLSIAEISHSNQPKYNRLKIPDELRDKGAAWLTTLVQCPEPVLQYLYMSGCDSVLTLQGSISSEVIGKLADQRRPEYPKLIFTPDSTFDTTQSRYGDKKAVKKTDSLMSSTVFESADSSILEDLQRERRELAANIASIEAPKSETEREKR